MYYCTISRCVSLKKIVFVLFFLVCHFCYRVPVPVSRASVFVPVLAAVFQSSHEMICIIICAVLRDVVRAERGDAQADRDMQTVGCHHQAGPPLPLRRGENQTNKKRNPDPKIATLDPDK
jgi:hypothetical protein